ncbi:hypothetical protein G4P62_019922 [Nothobranchius furzeri]|uniref:Uncharacterized protein n=1 Tax=Nothobranchius furzeri TaxID=105023 RepID=A0A9D2YVD7_NOTFU|nr:hypothetical protein G4P62_019922 [Nothobranchius furzeri]
MSTDHKEAIDVSQCRHDEEFYQYLALQERVQSEFGIIEKWLHDEKEKTVQTETDWEKYQSRIRELKQQLDVYEESIIDSYKITMETLKTQLEKKGKVCDQLKWLLKEESQLRLRCERGPINDRIRNSVYQKLRDEISECEQGLDFYQDNAETCKNTIQALKIQLEEQENVCESLQNCLKLESELRVTLKREKQNRDSLSDDFNKQIKDLKLANADLTSKIENFNSAENKEDKDLSEDLEDDWMVKEITHLWDEANEPAEQMSQILQQKSTGCKHPSFDDLFQTSTKDYAALQQLEKSFHDQRDERLKLKEDCEKSRAVISELNQKLDYYKAQAKPYSKYILELDFQLKEKDNLCKNLQKRIRRESHLLRLRFDQKEKNTQNKDKVYKKLKTEMCELEAGLDYYQSIAETLKQTIQTLKTQLQGKQSLAENLQSALKLKTELRLEFQQEQQNKDVLNEDLQKQIRELKKINHHLADKLKNLSSRTTQL